MAAQQLTVDEIEENKRIFNRYLEEFWNKGDLTVADETLAPDVRFHDLIALGLPPGPGGVKQNYLAFRKGFPDLQMTVEDMVTEGDRIAIRWTAHGVHKGDFQGIPATYRSGTITGMSFVRMVDGKIVEGWQDLDALGLLQQLGMFPSGSGFPKPLGVLITLRTRFEQARKRRKARR